MRKGAGISTPPFDCIAAQVQEAEQVVRWILPLFPTHLADQVALQDSASEAAVARLVATGMQQAVYSRIPNTKPLGMYRSTRTV